MKSSERHSAIRVLHVDDDPCILEISKEILKMEGNFEIDHASCVDEALKKMEAQSYDVVISDYEMPQKDGLQFLKELREQKNEIPFILFTGKGREEVAIKALNLGADAYHNKQGQPETVYGELSHGIELFVDRNKAKQALEESEKCYRTLMEQAAEAILVHDTKGQIIDANQRAYKNLGYTKAELLGMNIADIDSEAMESKKDVLLWPKVIAGEEFTFESNLKRKDKSTFPVEVSLGPITIGKETLVIGLIRDITERKKAEETLRESDNRLKKISAQTPGMLYQFKKRPDGTYCVPFTTEAIQNIFGCSSQEVREDFSPIAKVIVPEDLDKIVSSIEYSAEHLTPWQCEYRVKIPGQQVRWVWGQSLPEKLADGSIIWHGYNTDITERKKAEENLLNLKAFEERIVDSLGDALLVINPDDYTIISANEKALKQLKLRKEDLIGKTCYQTTHHRSLPCKLPEHACPIQEVIETGNPITVEHTHLDEDNNERIVEVSARPIMSAEGKTVIIHFAKEITERKQMETKIREAEKRYRALFDWAPLGILLIDPQTGKLVEFNEVAHEQLGYSREEFAKLHIYDYKALETPNETKAIMEKILCEGKAEWETKHRTKNGEVRDVVIVSQAVELSGRKLLQSIYRDVTEAKKIEVALMESEAKYRQLVELAQEGVWALDADNFTVYVNPRMAEMLGYAESEMIGKNLDTFLDNPGSDFARQYLEDCKLGDQDQCEFIFIRKDGARIYASVAASSIKDDEGSSIGTLSLVADITKRKKDEEELKNSHDKMETMNEKLRVVGSLTRHDVRNKLSAIAGYSYLLKKRHADQTDVVEGLDKMAQSVKEIERIFEFAKTYEQLGAEELAFVNVGTALDEAKALFSGPLPNIVNGCHGLTVLADSFVRQMFYNFIDNTRKYGKTTATIKVYCEKADEENLRLIYEDDGGGIPLENKQHLFREGFSTGGSTGFGLFLSKKMIDVYGWEIQEIGEPGKGVKFVMTIPKTSKNGEINYRIQ